VSKLAEQTGLGLYPVFGPSTVYLENEANKTLQKGYSFIL